MVRRRERRGVRITSARESDLDDVALLAQVHGIVAESLGVELSKVPVDASLLDEVGAESLDFLDIVFKLEQRFGIQITRGEMERAARGDMSDEDFAPDGLVSPAGLERLRTLMPESRERIVPGLRARQILGLFTVHTFAGVVRAKLAAKP